MKAIDHCEHALSRIPSADQVDEAIAEGMVMMVQLQELHAKACIATQEREKQVHQRKEQYEAMQLARENKRCVLYPGSAVPSPVQWCLLKEMLIQRACVSARIPRLRWHLRGATL
jgi:hypothetical protein